MCSCRGVTFSTFKTQDIDARENFVQDIEARSLKQDTGDLRPPLDGLGTGSQRRTENGLGLEQRVRQFQQQAACRVPCEAQGADQLALELVFLRHRFAAEASGSNVSHCHDELAEDREDPHHLLDIALRIHHEVARACLAQ